MRTSSSVRAWGPSVLPLVFMLVFVLGAAWPTSLAAQQTAERPRTDRRLPSHVRRAHDFLFAVYPDLLSRPLHITTTPVGQKLLVEVADAPTAPDGQLGEPLLTADVEFDAAGQLVAYSARGQLVEQVRNDLLWQQMRTHPEWGESDAEVWLLSVGGQATIGHEAPGAAIGTQQWHAFLGTQVTTEKSRFRWRGDAPDGQSQGVAVLQLPTSSRDQGLELAPATLQAPPTLAVRPAWVIDATASRDGASARYRFEFEPFGGRLIKAVRQ